MKNLLLFSDTFPYGTAEPFLQQELPYVAARFGRVEIVPLYIPDAASHPQRSLLHRPLPENVSVGEPLLRCNHKSVLGLLRYGLFCIVPQRYRTHNVKSVGGPQTISKSGLWSELRRRGAWHSLSKIRVILSYWLMRRAILSNGRAMAHIEERIGKGDLLYFYWGDKSALMLPALKHTSAVVRFHGSDVIEEAKGVLPFREELYRAVDYAAPVSNAIARYIEKNYISKPRRMQVFQLGSPESGRTKEWQRGPGSEVHIVSCSNIIPLKRVDLIAAAICKLATMLHTSPLQRDNAISGVSSIRWTHIGNGPLREHMEQTAAAALASAGIPSSLCAVEFKGAMPHGEVLKYYRDNHIDLFLHASRSEGGPVVIMEAASFGIPAISTDVGAVSEMLPQEWILPVDCTPDMFAAKVLEYLLLPAPQQLALKEQNRTTWELRWNAAANYAAFAEFLSSC